MTDFSYNGSDHLSDDTLSRLVDADLPPAEAATARAHLESCAACSSRRATLERLGDLVAAASIPEAPEPEPDRVTAAVQAAMGAYGEALVGAAAKRPLRRPRAVIGVAAAVAVLVGLGSFAIESSTHGSNAAGSGQSALRGGGSSGEHRAGHGDLELVPAPGCTAREGDRLFRLRINGSTTCVGVSGTAVDPHAAAAQARLHVAAPAAGSTSATPANSVPVQVRSPAGDVTVGYGRVKGDTLTVTPFSSHDLAILRRALGAK